MGVLQSPAVLLLVGAVAGIASGIFGIGGGLIMVPIFMYLLKMEPHKATATSLTVVVLPVALPAVLRLYQAGNVDLKTAAWVAAGFAVASLLGARMNLALNSAQLQRVFAVLLVFAAVQMYWKTLKPAPRPASGPEPPAAAQKR